MRAARRTPRVAVGGDPYGRPGLLQRPGRDGDVLQLERLARKRDVLLGPQPLDDLHPFHETLESLLFGQVEGIQLLLPVTEPEGEDGTALVHDVDGSQLLGDDHRVMKAEQRGGGAYAGLLDLGAEPAQERDLMQPLEAGDVVVLAHGDGLEAGFVGHPGLLRQGGEEGFGRLVVGYLGIELDAEFHGVLPCLSCQSVAGAGAARPCGIHGRDAAGLKPAPTSRQGHFTL